MGKSDSILLRCLVMIAGATGAACAPGASTTVAPSPSAVLTFTPVPPTAGATVNTTRPVATRTTLATSGTVTLTLWIVDELAPGATPAGRILRNQLDAFTAANPNIHIDVVPKKALGKGGMLDFLSTTRAVIPARLPDIAVLDISEVPLAADAQVLQPLDGLMPAEINADFFPFAAQAARYQNRWIAFPFAVDVEHLVYNRGLVRTVPPTWDEFLKQKRTLLLPLGGDDAFLLQYFGVGASLSGGPSPPSIDVNATAQVLTFLKRAHDLGLIPNSALSFKSSDEAWPTFAAGQVAMAQVSAAGYLAERSKLPNALYAPIPTREGKVATIATGWAFAIVTTDSTHQAAAARFIQWIAQGERLAPWLRAAHLLPATRSAVPLAVDPPEYATFMRDEMEHAVSLPPESSYAQLSDAWHNAIVAVINGQATPEEAARTAAGIK